MNMCVYLRVAVTVCPYVCLHMLVSCICLFVCLCFAGECCVFVLFSNGIQPLWICWQPGWLNAWTNSFMSINSKSSSGLWRYFFLTYMEVLMCWKCINNLYYNLITLQISTWKWISYCTLLLCFLNSFAIFKVKLHWWPKVWNNCLFLMLKEVFFVALQHTVKFKITVLNCALFH